jgi:hypothetical protein
MRLLRISIGGSMGLVAGVTLGLAAIRFSTPNVARTVLLLVLFGLGLAILAAVYRRGPRRAFWLGFALIGCGYLGLSSGSWTLSEKEAEAHSVFASFAGVFAGPRQPPPLGHWLVTTSLLDGLRLQLQADNGMGTPDSRGAVRYWFDPRPQAISAALERPLAMPFARETPLEDVLEYIKASTRVEHLPDGIPIYVDPVGLTESEKTMASPISLDLRGVPLRKSLSLLLQQIDLTYTVDGGLLTITSPTRISVADRVEAFRRVGHGLFALAFAMIGGVAARVLHATRPSREGEIARR